MLELDSADSKNQVLTVLRSGKEKSVVQTYGKKAVDGTVESTEAAEEPNKLLSVSMPLGLLKRAITQHGLSVEKFVKDFNINLLAVNFLWSDVPLLSVSAKIFSKMLLLSLTLEVLVWLSLVVVSLVLDSNQMTSWR